MNSPFTWGAGGQQVTMDQRRQNIARSLLGVQPIASPMQGVAQLAQAAVDKYNANPLNQFPDAPGGGGAFTGLFGLGGRIFGGGGGLY
jgi:hypothetical protein